MDYSERENITPTIRRQCHSLNRNGIPCRKLALSGSRFCHVHCGREEKLSAITEEQLRTVLKEHSSWISSQREKGKQADLRFRDLRGVQLPNANLQTALLSGADLEGANLRGANLAGADLHNTWLLDADIANADLREIRRFTKEQLSIALHWQLSLYTDDIRCVLDLPPPQLKDANLQGVDVEALLKWGAGVLEDNQDLKDVLKQARNWMLATKYSKKLLKDLGLPPSHNANLLERNLSKLDIPDQNISDGNLTGFVLTDINLQGATANRTIFAHSNLSGANFRGADLHSADFTDANLRDAVFLHSDLTSANLSQANLQGADFREVAGLKVDELHKCRNWRLAYFSIEMLARLELPKDHNKRLKNKDLSNTKTLYHADLTDADLSHFDLHNANIEDAIFRNTNLLDCNLQEAKLLAATDLSTEAIRSARNWILAFYSNDTLSQLGLPDDHNASVLSKNFRQADLSQANLQGANLQNYNLLDSNLEGANLKDAKGLTARSFAGANVANALLPDVFTLFDEKKTVEELIRYTRKLFTIMLLFCFYALLTVITSSDVQIITNSLSDPLPISRLTLPVVWLYAGIPIILWLLYLYFHVNLQRLWESLASLPAYFPDGRPVDNVVFPWIGNAVARTYLSQLSERPPLHHVQMFINTLLVWWIVPAMLLLMFGRYLPSHDWKFTSMHICLFSLSVGAAVAYKQLAANTFRRIEKPTVTPKSMIIAFLGGACLYAVSVAAIEGTRPAARHISFSEIPRATNSFPRSMNQEVRDFAKFLLPQILQVFGYSPFLALAGEQISTKPLNWDGETSSVVGASLERRNLRYADAANAFLAKANFAQADLTGITFTKADLRGADLRGADLRESDLRGVDLSHADLRKASIRGARLWGANMSYADVRGADLSSSDLRSVNLTGSFLQGAILLGANLRTAQLSGAKLMGADLSNANLSDANLDETDLQGTNLKFSDLRGARIRHAFLWGTQLQSADLRGANFKNSTLQSIDFSGVNLQDADFRGAVGIDLDALEKADNWAFAYYDADLNRRLGLPDNFADRLKAKDFSGLRLASLRLRGGDFRSANFEVSDLSGSDLKGADLRGANLKGCKLVATNLQGVDLRSAEHLDAKQVTLARNWALALLDERLASSLGLSTKNNARRLTLVGDRLLVDLSGEELGNANLIGAELQGSNLRGVQLRGADLTDADLTGADLTGGDLRSALLTRTTIAHADLQWAKLEGVKGISSEALKSAKNWFLASYSPEMLDSLGLAHEHNENLKTRDFSYSKLPGVSLNGSHIRGSNFERADLIDSDLRLAKLEEVNFKDADLSDADLSGANITAADFRGANLQGTILWGVVGVTAAQLRSASNWPLAYYDNQTLDVVGLPSDHIQKLRNKSLSNYQLPGVDFKNADFSGFDLTEANLRGADLTGANVSGAVFLRADLAEVTFGDATGISKSSISESKNWIFAHYGQRILEEMGLPSNHTQNMAKRDFRNYDISSQNLESADFEGFNLEGANLSNSSLLNANLLTAKLQGSNLRGVNLTGANLVGTMLEDADLQGVDFREAHGLEIKEVKAGRNWVLARYDKDTLAALGLDEDHNATIAKKDLQRAQLDGINLEGADLSDALLQGANMRGATLRRADLRGAKLQGPKWFSFGANLSGADLEGADLRGAQLECERILCGSADLAGANLSGANIEGVGLSGVDIDEADFRGTIGVQVPTIKKAKNWDKALFDDAVRQQLATGHSPDEASGGTTGRIPPRKE